MSVNDLKVRAYSKAVLASRPIVALSNFVQKRELL
jgi:hypothetical protein